jgi:class 3 adenylate cyclase
MEAEESFELPGDPVLREAAVTMEDTGHAGWVFDPDWNLVHVSDELRLIWSDASGSDRAMFPIGVHLFSTAMIRASASWQFGLTTIEFWRGFVRSIGGLVLADTPGGRQQLRELVDPALRDLVDELTPEPATVSWVSFVGAGVGEARSAPMTVTRVRDASGRLCGSVVVGKPAAGMSTLMGMAHARDVPHLERMERLSRAGRRPAAILFADLEGSSSLSRRLSTARYFTLGRRLVRAADRSVVEAGGLVGRHVGDGVVAFFPSETTTSESAAARACIEAARSLRDAVAQVALDTGLDADDVTLRFGLHWGAALYIGRITTLARTEVTALGDEVNEGARIEACASGGRTLASKNLVERLDADDAEALGLDPDGMVYITLAELSTATDKARRDAPAIAVCEV